jgi:hypothetical protein
MTTTSFSGLTRVPRPHQLRVVEDVDVGIHRDGDLRVMAFGRERGEQRFFASP